MTGTERRRPIVAIVAAAVGGLMLLLCGGGAMIGMRLLDDAPLRPIDYVVVGAVAVGAGLAFASAVLASRRPFAAGLFASLAVLPVGGVLVTVYGFAFSGSDFEIGEPIHIFGYGVWYGPYLSILVLSIATWLFVTVGPCVLAAILNFRRWGQGRRPDTAAADGDEGATAQ